MEFNDFFVTRGEQLQIDLNLQKFGDNCFIQKAMQLPISLYIVTFNSKYPNVYLGASKVKKIKSTRAGKLVIKNSDIVFDSLKLTPPLQLNISSINPIKGSIFILRDISGEYLRNPKMFECTNKNQYEKMCL